ncbi:MULTISPECIES: thiamine pyrophosphate-binding protein [Pectobacterium]|uniref:Thiamine pyrophosphate-binding protein n=1 Tax=Pectobacterium aquaticum TaxID=2204145 RepID=A0AA93ARI4_9GAMM|nr:MULTISPECIES: thiamine pyrophosphate-binding protein [Pectobacterium]MBE5202625.1 thiamine pyrophosphate-binding protein [Pectobacterium quasiaquaticum]MBE5211091.1 thiamine pyrophosphate-binding protein [Pectobacterium quasiaquaticum]MBE5222869.1 thiamine pyrophosphate-binding protein [Pectobacterium quasiaquaticum]RRO22746.1 thiamine pyrophosphate-binding protein [Pectobacterium aquaticum]
MKASDAIAEVLAENNVTYGFELIGGMITHLVDSINLLGKTKLLSVHHEQSASFAAGGVARATFNKELGVALGTSGPGATNLVTGIADCWFDSHPAIFITGQVNTDELKNDRPIRQQGFQELDIISIVKSITKYSHQIKSVDEIIPCLQEAIDISRTGRPGPVLIDIPMNLQRADIPASALDYLKSADSIRNLKNTEEDVDFSLLFKALKKSNRPLFLIGGGAVNEPSFNAWVRCVECLNIPYVCSLKGSEKTYFNKNMFGLIGAYGTRTANYAIQNCDLLVVLGSRLDVRQTGANVSTFSPGAHIIQIDIDAGQLDNRIRNDVKIEASCESFFNAFLHNSFYSFSHEWIKELQKHWDELYTDEYTDWSISPYAIFSLIADKFENIRAQFVADVGNNQMWAAHSLKLGQGQMIHHSGGLGAMGFALPSAIGVHCATKELTVVITGDGGLQLNIQELDVISRESLPILVLVMNNASLGMVRTFQELYFDGRNSSTYWKGYSSKFTEVAKAYGIESHLVSSLDMLDKYLQQYISHPGPMFIEISMYDATECRPRLSFGKPIDQQAPLKVFSK